MHFNEPWTAIKTHINNRFYLECWNGFSPPLNFMCVNFTYGLQNEPRSVRHFSTNTHNSSKPSKWSSIIFFGCVFSFSHNRSKWLAMQQTPNSQASSVSSAWHIYCIKCLWDLLSLCVCVCRKIFTKSRSCKDCRSFISIQTKPGFFIWHDIIDLVQTTNNKRRIPKRNGFLFSYKRIGSDEFISEQT